MQVGPFFAHIQVWRTRSARFASPLGWQPPGHRLVGRGSYATPNPRVPGLSIPPPLRRQPSPPRPQLAQCRALPCAILAGACLPSKTLGVVGGGFSGRRRVWFVRRRHRPWIVRRSAKHVRRWRARGVREGSGWGQQGGEQVGRLDSAPAGCLSQIRARFLCAGWLWGGWGRWGVDYPWSLICPARGLDQPECCPTEVVFQARSFCQISGVPAPFCPWSRCLRSRCDPLDSVGISKILAFLTTSNGAKGNVASLPDKPRRL